MNNLQLQLTRVCDKISYIVLIYWNVLTECDATQCDRSRCSATFLMRCLSISAGYVMLLRQIDNNNK